MRYLFQICFSLALAATLTIALGVLPQGRVKAADRATLEAFLEVTGFDVALDSISLSASSAPNMLGMNASDFGDHWTRLTEDVFDRGEMRGRALDILEETLDDASLNYAVDFYASDLGQRLVRAENASHMVEDDEVKTLAGQRIIAHLVQKGSQRLALFQRMGRAIDTADSGLRAVQLIQYRFLMAANAAGVIDLKVDSDGLRALLKEQAPKIRMELRASNMAASAYTYQEFSDEEVATYVDALEAKPMQRVYELLNAVQYEITANRFEELAYRLKGMEQGEDI